MPTILYITKGIKAASTRYRATDYFPLWRDAGWQPLHASHDGSLSAWYEILRTARRADVVVVVRRTFRFPFLQLLRMVSRRLVFDFDDAIFVRGSGETSTSKSARFARTVAACDMVWAGNPYLAEHAGRHNAQVLVIPTALRVQKYAVTPARRDDGIDLVWIGSLTTRKHLLTILPALERAAQTIKGLRLRVIADFSIETRDLEIEAVQWSSQGEADALASAHVGIAPLPDNPFTRGKCGLKVLQYMAAGLPVIASPVGVNAELVHEGVTGYTAVTPDDWVQAMERLAADAELRRRMGNQGRRICTEEYALEGVFRRMLASLDGIDVG